MKLCRVGNQTNSPDPVAVNSRVFVGNLNTFQCSKAELERMFQRYGRIAGISMHKGYAFVQFANAFDARSACLGEDKRVVLGQTLDVNLVSEPKAHQTGRKRQNVTKTGNDWDYYYDSYYASVGLSAGPPPPPRLAPGPPHKRPRLMVPLARPVPSGPPGPPGTPPGMKHGPCAPCAPCPPPMNGHLPPLAVSHLQPHVAGPAGGAGPTGPPTGPGSPPPSGHHSATINVFSNPDILICGNCREMYTDLQELLSHKKAHCKLRFACKCHTLPEGKSNHEATLLCSSCRASFSSAWDLMVHVQAAHMLNIYQLGVPDSPPEAAAEAHSDGLGDRHSDSHSGSPQPAVVEAEPGSPVPPPGPAPAAAPAPCGRQSPAAPAEPLQQQQQQQQPLHQQQHQQQPLQQVDQTLSPPASQLSLQQSPANQPPTQEAAAQVASERLQCPGGVSVAAAASQPAADFSPRSSASSPSLEADEAHEAHAQIQDAGVASPAASTSSDPDAGVVVASLASLVGATLQCNLTAEPLKDDEALLLSSPEPASDAAWEAATQQV